MGQMALPRKRPIFGRKASRPSTKVVPGNFQTLIGAAAWARLPMAVRERFACHAADAVTQYNGAMEVVRCSVSGYFLAQLCRLFGTPLAPFQGTHVPMTVRVYEDGQKGGIVWERIYHFPGKRPIAVRSTKVFAQNNHLLECVGGGFGMRLKVFEEDRKLHFLSTDYFWKGLGLTIPLPKWVSPGTAHVIHTDEGNGWFRFTMTIEHPVLGETFFQDGSFREEA